MIGPLELILAFILDLAIGDPRWLPHPVRIIGKAILYMEDLLRSFFSGSREKAGGVILILLIVLPSALLTYLLCIMLREATSGFLLIMSEALLIYLVGTTIALRELVSSAKQVIDSIKAGMLDDARQHLSMIVGRDTAELSEDGVLRATIETLAENLSDGVIAPVFYLAIGGLPLAIAYKAINTLDSMVGYKNEKYFRFGWAAARLDDIANYIPSRLSGLLVVISSCIIQRSFSAARYAMNIMFRDSRNHTSPNSGVPEAAMAGALGIRLGGPSTYGGVVIAKPYIGDIRNIDYLSAARKTGSIVIVASGLSVIAAAVILELVRTSR
ncbi:MAG: cobalamin biosynthesis protein CobD [Nitrospirae bacterium]|nr:cobalamin biosynthesis protein CobD [Nitrospirota bacterium]